MIGLREWTLPVVIAAIVAFFAAMSPDFLSARNFSMLLIEISITAVLAVGMLLVILPGNIDLSAGSGVGLAGGLAAVLVHHANWPALFAMLVPFVLVVLVWMGMGLLIEATGIQAFIVTLGGMLIFRGLFWLVIRSTTVPVSHGGEYNLLAAVTTSYLSPAVGLGLMAASAVGAFALLLKSSGDPGSLGKKPDVLPFLKVFVGLQTALLIVLACNKHRGVPLAFLILCAVAFAAHVTTQRTPFGRYLVAIGGNSQAAILSGIPVTRVVVVSFGLLGGIVALTGFMQTSYAGASTVSVGELMELDAIAACVIGGTSLKGGRGTVAGTLRGATIMSLLLNGMTLLAVDPEMKFIVRGAVLVLAVLMDISTQKSAATTY